MASLRCKVCGDHTHRDDRSSTDDRCDDCIRRGDFADLVARLPKLPINIDEMEGRARTKLRFTVAAKNLGWSPYDLTEVLEEADNGYFLDHFFNTLRKFVQQ